MYLFTTKGMQCKPLAARQTPLEGDLHDLFESNLRTLLGVTRLAREFDTGSGRMDTLGMDEYACPVIIEYKRGRKDSIINQALYYQSWLLDHKLDFEHLANQHGYPTVDWSGVRLICIAADFSPYDTKALDHISANIDLVRYTLFGDDILGVDLHHRRRLSSYRKQASNAPVIPLTAFVDRLNAATDNARAFYNALEQHMSNELLLLCEHDGESAQWHLNGDPVAYIRLAQEKANRLICEIAGSHYEIQEAVSDQYAPLLKISKKTRCGFEVKIYDQKSLDIALVFISALTGLKDKAISWSS